MAVARSHVEEVALDLEGRFLAAGYLKRHGVLWRPFSKNFYGFLGLGRVTYDKGRIALFNATVGVRFHTVYDMQVSLGASPATKTGCNLTSSLSYLMEKEGEYRFVQGEGHETAAAQLIQDVLENAEPFFEKLKSPELALQAAESGTPIIVSGKSEFIPVACYMQGRFDDAVRIAENFGNQFAPNRAQGRVYHRFIANLKQACDSAQGVSGDL